jgi:hypothetical protein
LQPERGRVLISDEELQEYVNKFFSEEVIQQYENQLLSVMKFRYKKYPTEINDKEWLDFTNYVCCRRCQRNSKTNTKD